MWHTKKLNEVCDIQSGLWKGKKGPYTTALVLRNTNFTASGVFDYSNVVELEVEAKQLAKREVIKNDIILEKSGGGDKTPVGRVCIHDKESKIPFSLSNFTARIRVLDSKELNAEFLHKFLYFLYISGKTEPMQRHSTGIRNLQLTQYKEIDVPLPPLEEQQRIVAKLDAAFAEIDEAVSKEKLKEMENEKLKAKILSNFLHHKDSDKFKLNEICFIKNGGTPKTKIESYWGGDIKWLTPKDMGKINGKFVNDSGRKISNNGLKNSSAKLIPSESLILSCRAPIGHVFINKIEMSFNQGCKGLVINENEKVNVEYLYYFLLSSKKLLNDLGTGTTFKEISSKVLGNVEIALPALHKQEEIIAKLNAAFSEIENIKQFIKSKKQNYAALKAAILSKELQSSEAA